MESFDDGSNDDLGLTFILYGKVKFALWAFIWEESMAFINDLVQKINKCSKTGVNKNILLH